MVIYTYFGINKELEKLNSQNSVYYMSVLIWRVAHTKKSWEKYFNNILNVQIDFKKQ